MRLNVRFTEDDERIFGVRESDESFRLGFGELQTQTITENDYNKLKNKPSINSVVLEGAMTAEDLGLGRIYYDTSANWNMQGSLIAERAAIYIYSDRDYLTDDDGNLIPVAGMKVGDGSSYLIDMPFTDDALLQQLVRHIYDRNVHVSEYDRTFWNNKVSTLFNDGEPENLVFSKTRFVID